MIRAAILKSRLTARLESVTGTVSVPVCGDLTLNLDAYETVQDATGFDAFTDIRLLTGQEAAAEVEGALFEFVDAEMDILQNGVSPREFRAARDFLKALRQECLNHPQARVNVYRD